MLHCPFGISRQYIKNFLLLLLLLNSHCNAVKLLRRVSSSSTLSSRSDVKTEDASMEILRDVTKDVSSFKTPRDEVTQNSQPAKWLFWNEFSTENCNPMEHAKQDVSRFYQISSEDHKQFFPTTIDTNFRQQTKIFRELSLMVREPALEIIDVLKKYDFQNPIAKFILYGRRGCGKTMSLAHTMHYCGKADFVIAHIPWVPFWIEPVRQTNPSDSYENLINRPEDSLSWLKYFTKMNKSFIKNYETTKTYNWSKKEATEAGSPLKSLLEFGIDRVAYSDDVVVALFEELESLATQDRIKVLIGIDGVNALWKKASLKFRGEAIKTNFDVKQITIFDSIMKFVSSKPKNSALVCTVDAHVNPAEDRENYRPKNLLGKEGFLFLEPFIPVEVVEYSDQEMLNCLAYYNSKLWIQNPEAKTEDGTKQLSFLSNKNPFELYRLCSYN